MITFKNTEVTSNWFIDLKEYSQVEGILPLNGFNLRNDSNIVAYVDLEGIKVGEVQRYSADQFQGRNFELIRVYNPDGQEFAPDDLFIQATKGEVFTSQPFNPQWDMMFFELDRFATGTDSRMSLSAVNTKEIIKYWVNVQNSVIVQRRLDIQAHATLLGDYTITFSPSDILSGAVGIGIPPPPDTLQYKKTIQNSEFNYAVTNALIQGWVIDLKVNPGDISDEYTVVVGSDPSNAYDDDLTTFAHYSSYPDTWVTVLELSFNSRSVSDIHTLITTTAASASAYARVLLEVNGVWTEVFSVGESTYYLHDVTGWDLVTGVRFQTRNSNASSSYKTYLKIYDLSIF